MMHVLRLTFVGLLILIVQTFAASQIPNLSSTARAYVIKIDPAGSIEHSPSFTSSQRLDLPVVTNPTDNRITVQFIARSGQVIDQHLLWAMNKDTQEYVTDSDSQARIPGLPVTAYNGPPVGVINATSPQTTTLKLTPTLTTQPGIKYVVIVSIDGLRPDALEFAHTPTLDGLRAKGAYSPNAQTVDPSVTLPSHASMISGMVPQKHGILWGLPYIGWPGMNGPTLFNVAHDAGLKTAMVFGKDKMGHLVLPHSVDQLFGADVHDPEIKEQALKFIQADMPTVLFIHFPDVDRVGHAYGWMSDNQFHAITFVDGLLGEIIAALEEGHYLSNTFLIVTADHGGHGQGHGDDSPEDRTIPWLAVGPGVPPGLILTNHINIYDTAPTVLYALKLPIPEKWDGQSVLEIFED